MKKILSLLLVLTMCLGFFACGKKEDKSAVFSLEEMVSDPEFQQIFSDSEDEVFKYSVSASSSDVLLYEATAKKTYDEADLEFFRSKTDEEISDKLGLADLQKTLKMYGFGKVTIDFKMYNGDGTLITERTLG